MAMGDGHSARVFLRGAMSGRWFFRVRGSWLVCLCLTLMSLKAKIEAVIYASDEPVTLSQLVGLLGVEAQAELDRAAAAQQRLALEDAAAEQSGRTLGPESEAEPASENSVDVGQPTEKPDVVQAEEADALPEASAAIAPTDAGESVTNGAPDSDSAADSAARDSVAAADSAVAAADSAARDFAAAAAAAVRAERARAAKLRGYFRELLDRLIAEYTAPESDRGLEIREVAGGFKFATKPEYHDAVRGFVKSLKPPLKLTLQSLETLAVVAYKQPVTSPEISEIRGVDSSGVLGSLIARKLITTAGRKHVIGRPILYRTTKEFLLKFGLKDLGELPSIEEFERMAEQMAEQEEIPIPMESERDETAVTSEAVEQRLQSDGEAPAPESVADEVIVDGRVSGLPPRYDDADDLSAQEAEQQESEQVLTDRGGMDEAS